MVLAFLLILGGYLLPGGGEVQSTAVERTSKSEVQPTSSVITILNQGGNMEGHTPRGFAGSGTGLFTGDNLNPNFPEGDGVQLFITFDLSEISGLGAEVSSAILRANSAEVRGTPFKDLGNLLVDAVSYDTFSENLWDLNPSERVCTLSTSGNDAYECDVSSYVRTLVNDGTLKVQLRIRFDKAGDSDGSQDMVFFNATDANANNPGIFELEVTTRNGSEDIEISVTAYLVSGDTKVSTLRTRKSLEELFKNSQEIWSQAGIVLNLSIKEIVLNRDLASAVASGSFMELYRTLPPENQAFNIFYVRNLLGPNGIALAPSVALVADITTVDDFRATAHEIGHLLGLRHTLQSKSRLMFPGANGRNLSDGEIVAARAGAGALK